MQTDVEDLVSSWLQRQGCELVLANPAHDLALPGRLSDVDATVVYGGAQSANDPFSYLDDERRWLDACLQSDQPVLAICLGAQLLAQVLGGRVYGKADGRKEIGWYEIQARADARNFLERNTYFYQWHGEGFDVPSSVRPLADGKEFPNQAFCVGDKVIATQFHPEVDTAIVKRWISEAGDEQIVHCPDASAQVPRQLADCERYVGASSNWLERTLHGWHQNFAGESHLT